MAGRSYIQITKRFMTIFSLGLSMFATTFVMSLLIGTAGEHPVLGPLDVLYGYIATILWLSLLIVLAEELLKRAETLAPRFMPQTVRVAHRRQLIESSLQGRLRSAPQPLRRRVPVR